MCMCADCEEEEQPEVLENTQKAPIVANGEETVVLIVDNARTYATLISTQRDCITSMNKLITMERERQDLLIGHLVKTERGIPRLPETPEESVTNAQRVVDYPTSELQLGPNPMLTQNRGLDEITKRFIRSQAGYILMI
ncbi:hypothetical protein PRIPAC_95786 [Pristionchus pacificus]|uniref:Uncharacterized protein n=1 Tax=Pristionchus pacificus TaxID=54126 RepID=A0A2A6BDB5_PRIPA|nr:hypothetical protein PRIPAC_95786 [Pristionchus pacificus]|eukprot:PDM63872.1 hypothetical protein PRIPAC_49845 [Pristionchus pacificus]